MQRSEIEDYPANCTKAGCSEAKSRITLQTAPKPDAAKRNRGLPCKLHQGRMQRSEIEGWPQRGHQAKGSSTILILSTVFLDSASLHRGYEQTVR
jgi:hypothetical protein